MKFITDSETLLTISIGVNGLNGERGEDEGGIKAGRLKEKFLEQDETDFCSLVSAESERYVGHSHIFRRYLFRIAWN